MAPSAVTAEDVQQFITHFFHEVHTQVLITGSLDHEVCDKPFVPRKTSHVRQRVIQLQEQAEKILQVTPSRIRPREDIYDLPDGMDQCSSQSKIRLNFC